MTTASRKRSDHLILFYPSVFRLPTIQFLQFTFERTTPFNHYLCIFPVFRCIVLDLKSPILFANTATSLHFPLCSFVIPFLPSPTAGSSWFECRTAAQSHCSCRPPIRSRPFAFSSLDKGGKEEFPQFLDWIVPGAGQPFGFTQHIIKRTMRGRKGTRVIEEPRSSSQRRSELPLIIPRLPERIECASNKAHLLLCSNSGLTLWLHSMKNNCMYITVNSIRCDVCQKHIQ